MPSVAPYTVQPSRKSPAAEHTHADKTMFFLKNGKIRNNMLTMTATYFGTVIHSTRTDTTPRSEGFATNIAESAITHTVGR